MSDWEQRLRLYTSSAASSTGRRSTSPANLLDELRPSLGTASSPYLAGVAAQQRAKSPNALERLRASTAMNLMALEVRRQESGIPAHRAGSPDPPPAAYPRTGAGASTATMTIPSGGGWALPGDDIVYRAGSGSGRDDGTGTAPPRADSPVSRYEYSGGKTSQLPLSRNSPPSRGTASNSSYASPTPHVNPVTLAESFQPHAILQMLEAKIRSLETRNQHLEASVQTLTTRNKELVSELADAEARAQTAAALQSTVHSMSHELDRLRDELVNAAQREERRVEDVRRRLLSEVEEERRHSAAREQEILGLRSAIRQLASIERGSD